MKEFLELAVEFIRPSAKFISRPPWIFMEFNSKEITEDF